MTRSSSILDPSGDPADAIYEAIGQKFLEQCSFDEDGSLSMHGSMISEDLIGELDSFVASRGSRPKSEWLRTIKRVLQSLTPADYAIHGKRICLAMLDWVEAQEDERTSGPSEGDSVIWSPASAARSAASARLPRAQRPASLAAAEYSQFPKWLPTMSKSNL
jgi:hypothetical protein